MKKQKSPKTKLLDFEKQQIVILEVRTVELKGGRGMVIEPDG